MSTTFLFRIDSDPSVCCPRSYSIGRTSTDHSSSGLVNLLCRYDGHLFGDRDGKRLRSMRKKRESVLTRDFWIRFFPSEHKCNNLDHSTVGMAFWTSDRSSSLLLIFSLASSVIFDMDRRFAARSHSTYQMMTGKTNGERVHRHHSHCSMLGCINRWRSSTLYRSSSHTIYNYTFRSRCFGNTFVDRWATNIMRRQYIDGKIRFAFRWFYSHVS